MVGSEQGTKPAGLTEAERPDPAAESAAALKNREWFGGLQCVCPIQLIMLDDETTICEIVKKALAHKDLKVDTVSDPGAIEAKLREERGKYHVIILDYVIPGLESQTVLNWLQEYQAQAGIVVMTAYPSIDSAVHSLRARAFDYLTKPFQIPDLKAVVLRCLESKGLLRMSEEALRESLGAAIRERRKAQGLTLAQMAERANVSLGYLSQIELGKNSASIETLYRISLGLGVRMADLFEQAQLHSQVAMNAFNHATWALLGIAALCVSVLATVRHGKGDNWPDALPSLMFFSLFAAIFTALLAWVWSLNRAASPPRHSFRKWSGLAVRTLVVVAVICAVAAGNVKDDCALHQLLVLITIGLWLTAPFGGFAMWIWLRAVDRAVVPPLQNQDAPRADS